MQGRYLSFTALGAVLQPLLDDNATERSTSTAPGARRSQARAAGSPAVKGNFLHRSFVEQARAAGVYFGPVYAPRPLSNPGARSMEVVVRENPGGSPGTKPQEPESSARRSISSVIQDLVRQTRLGTSGYVYAVDARACPSRTRTPPLSRIVPWLFLR